MTNNYCCNINSNEGDPKTSLDDLNNEMLLEILCRLPCYRTALSCKAVSKRWYSLISDPLFITQAFLAHRKTIEKQSSLAFLLTISMWGEEDVTAMVAPPCSLRTLWSPILSLQFLPHRSTCVATFKDLVLSHGINPLTGLDLFCICNPLTKQWIILPPSPIQQKHGIWAALTYLEGRGFRVVVVAFTNSNYYSRKDTFVMVNLSVYISETCQWRDIDVRFQLQRPFNDGYTGNYCAGVVCQGMVCIDYGDHYFGAFNPFDVTPTFQGTLTAIDLPFPAGDVQRILESDGKLVAFEDIFITLRCNSEGKYLTEGKRIWKLDMRLNNDNQLRQWELISEPYGPMTPINVKGSILTPPHRYGYATTVLAIVGVHPSKEHLVYLVKRDRNTQHRFILYDTKSKSLEALTATNLRGNIYPCNKKLDIPCWPTPIPIPL